MNTLQSSSVRRLITRLNSSWGFYPKRHAPSSKSLSAFMASILILALLPLLACNDSKTPTNQPLTRPTKTAPVEDVVFTIGNLTDQTGVASSAVNIIDIALKDLIDYYNSENLIPGVELQIKSYDTQYDSALAKTGYEQVVGKGADIIWTPVTSVIVVLKPVADKDEIPVFAASSNLDTLLPPGYAFSLGTIPQYDAYTFLKWIAENDWDYEKKGPAKIGGAGWKDDYSPAFFDGMKEYAELHPEQFEWKGGFLTDFGFVWDSQIEALKDCDYVYPPVPMQVFIKSYRDAGHDAKFIGVDPHAGFLDMIDKGEYWDEIAGMLFIRGSRWWTEEGVIIDLTKELLNSNHNDSTESIMRSGVGYLATSCLYQLMQIIKNAAEEVGAENLNSQAVYDAAVNYVEDLDGVDRYSFNESKRCSTNYYVIYEADGEKKNLYRADPDWLPLITEP